jgi:hypothetical protein
MKQAVEKEEKKEAPKETKDVDTLTFEGESILTLAMVFDSDTFLSKFKNKRH